MSLKEDIEVVKQEVSTEEQFLSGFIKTEKFVKKYKKVFLSALAIIIVSGVGYVAYDYYEQDRIAKANEALNKLMQNPADKASLETLQAKSPKLYEAYSYINTISKGDKENLKTLFSAKNQIVADLSKYHHAVMTSNENELRSYASSNDSMLKDFANFLMAQKAIDRNDTKAAAELLSKIPASSNLKEQAVYLDHLLLKSKTK